MDIQNKCCGNCKHFKGGNVLGDGYCRQLGIIVSTDIYCGHHDGVNNGWTEITPDNVKELYKVLDRVVVAHVIPDTVVKDVVAYERTNELYRSLEIIAELGGYYYYVLPELKIE